MPAPRHGLSEPAQDERQQRQGLPAAGVGDHPGYQFLVHADPGAAGRAGDDQPQHVPGQGGDQERRDREVGVGGQGGQRVKELRADGGQGADRTASGFQQQPGEPALLCWGAVGQQFLCLIDGEEEAAGSGRGQEIRDQAGQPARPVYGVDDGTGGPVQAPGPPGNGQEPDQLSDRIGCGYQRGQDKPVGIRGQDRYQPSPDQGGLSASRGADHGQQTTAMAAGGDTEPVGEGAAVGTAAEEHPRLPGGECCQAWVDDRRCAGGFTCSVQAP